MKIALVTSDNREGFRNYERLQPEFDSAPEALLQGFAALGPEVEVHVLSCVQQPVQSPAKLAENTFFHSLHVPRLGWLRTGYGGCIRAVRRKLREIGPDIVHGQGTEREGAICAAFSGHPNVVTVHGNMRHIARLHHSRPFSFFWCMAQLERLTIPRADGVVCITRYTLEAVKALARRTWLFPNAVDQRFFDLRPVSGKTCTLLCVASVIERKNQNRLILALDQVKRPPGFEVLFFGRAHADDPYAQAFFALIKDRPWCRYCGFADRDTLRAQYAGARALVLPSLEDNCPMVVLEAMAAGLPFAASAVGGTPELVVDGKTGILFDPYDVQAMAAELTRLLEDPPLTAAAREDALARFHPLVIARKHLEVYRDVLARR